MAADALRVIALAYRDLPAFDPDQQPLPDDNGVFGIETEGLTLLALLGITDVLREGVFEAVQSCQQAGIKVRMVTGDNKATAAAVARRCGILGPAESAAGRVMEGREFMQLVGGVVCAHCRTARCPCDLKHQPRTPVPDSQSDSHLDTEKPRTESPARPAKTPKRKPGASRGSSRETGLAEAAHTHLKEETDSCEAADPKPGWLPDLPRRVRVDTIKNGREFDRLIGGLSVLARSRPEDKYAVVVGLKERGHVVAVTGDGSNDAPALSKADVGFAMGLAGTDLAKKAAAIIITDDNFSSIVSAVVRGRNVYDSIRKFLTFQLTVNVVAVVGTFLGGLCLDHAVISAVQMLWINLIMDTLASLALATEPPVARELLRRPPHGKSDSIVSQKMLKHILGQSLFQLAVLALIVCQGPRLFSQVRGTLWDKGTLGSAARDEAVDADSHSTAIFNTFVMMQLGNFLNCRQLHDERNVFRGLTRSRMFGAIWLLILLLQVLIVTCAGKAFNLAPRGLDLRGWAVCALIGALSLPLALLLKALPEEALCCGKPRPGRAGHFSESMLEEEHAQLSLPAGEKQTGRPLAVQRN